MHRQQMRDVAHDRPRNGLTNSPFPVNHIHGGRERNGIGRRFGPLPPPAAALAERKQKK